MWSTARGGGVQSLDLSYCSQGAHAEQPVVARPFAVIGWSGGGPNAVHGTGRGTLYRRFRTMLFHVFSGPVLVQSGTLRQCLWWTQRVETGFLVYRDMVYTPRVNRHGWARDLVSAVERHNYSLLASV